jgi:hypothetical protein
MWSRALSLKRSNNRLNASGVTAENRLATMLFLLSDWRSHRSLVWEVFQTNWPNCDEGSAQSWQKVSDLLRYTGPPTEMLEGADLALYNSIPAKLTLWRGCARDFARGLSWTLAKRRARDCHLAGATSCVIAKGRSSKGQVLTVSASRGEQEVLVDPAKPPKLLLTSFPYLAVDASMPRATS